MQALWRMPRKQRLRLWEALGRYDTPLESLELGGDFLSICPLDAEELQMLLPASLDSVRSLFLGKVSMLGDAAFQILAASGCGEHLSSLFLHGEDSLSRLLFFSLFC